MRRSSLSHLAIGLSLCLALACGKKPGPVTGQSSPLYTGKESKRKVVLSFPASSQVGFISVEREIYATESLVSQAKQIMLHLMAGPSTGEPQAAAPFGAGATYREIFVDGKGLAVLDLPATTVQGLAGGTSGEVATLYAIVRTLTANVQGVGRVQVLVDGQTAASLAGHVDIQDPLTLADF